MRIRPGAKGELAGVVNGSLCARVGVHEGQGGSGDPYYSALVRSRPPGSNGWIASREGGGQLLPPL